MKNVAIIGTSKQFDAFINSKDSKPGVTYARVNNMAMAQKRRYDEMIDLSYHSPHQMKYKLYPIAQYVREHLLPEKKEGQ